MEVFFFFLFCVRVCLLFPFQSFVVEGLKIQANLVYTMWLFAQVIYEALGYAAFDCGCDRYTVVAFCTFSKQTLDSQFDKTKEKMQIVLQYSSDKNLPVEDFLPIFIVYHYILLN